MSTQPAQAAQPQTTPAPQAKEEITPADKELLGWAKNMRGWMQSDKAAAEQEFGRVMTQMHPQKAAPAAPAQIDPDDPIADVRAQVAALSEAEERRAAARVTQMVDETLASASDVFKKGTPAFDDKAFKVARQNMLAAGTHNPGIDFQSHASELAALFVQRKVDATTQERDTRAAQQQNMATLPPSQGAPQVTVPRKAAVEDWDNGKREEQYRQRFAKDGLKGIFGRDFGGR